MITTHCVTLQRSSDTALWKSCFMRDSK